MKVLAATVTPFTGSCCYADEVAFAGLFTLFVWMDGFQTPTSLVLFLEINKTGLVHEHAEPKTPPQQRALFSQNGIAIIFKKHEKGSEGC